MAPQAPAPDYSSDVEIQVINNKNQNHTDASSSSSSPLRPPYQFPKNDQSSSSLLNNSKTDASNRDSTSTRTEVFDLLSSPPHLTTPRKSQIVEQQPLFLLSSPGLPTPPPQRAARSDVKGKGKLNESFDIELLDESDDDEDDDRMNDVGIRRRVSIERSMNIDGDDDDDEMIIETIVGRNRRSTSGQTTTIGDDDDDEEELPQPFLPITTKISSRRSPPTASSSRRTVSPLSLSSEVVSTSRIRSKTLTLISAYNSKKQTTTSYTTSTASTSTSRTTITTQQGRIPSKASSSSTTTATSAILSILDNLAPKIIHSNKSAQDVAAAAASRKVLIDSSDVEANGVEEDDDDVELEETQIDSYELASINGRKDKGKGKEKSGRKTSKSVESGWDSERDGAKDGTKGKKKTSSTTSTSKAAEREALKAAKTLEKQQKQAEKQRLALEKSALNKANVLRAGNKASTVTELTLHCSGLGFDEEEDASSSDDEDESEGGERGKRRKSGGKRKKKRVKKSEQPQWMNITTALKERLEAQGCIVERPEVVRKDLGCEGALRWTRWCDRKWNMEKNIFEPLEEGNEIIVEEDSRLVYMSALDLSRHIANRTLVQHLNDIQKLVGEHVQIIVMHYGSNALFREMENAKQAVYRDATRARLENAQVDGAGVPKVVGIGTDQPDKESVQLELLRVQAQSRCFIIAVNSVDEAVDWIEQLTYDVSQKPYQRQKNMHIAALGTGEEKLASGSNLQDTFIKMLATMKGVTEPVAKSIVSHYPTIKDLYDNWAKLPKPERKNMLVGIHRGNLLSGAATNRAIGAVTSENVYKVFTSGEFTWPDSY